MIVNLKRSTCNKITPLMKWLVILSIVFKALYDIWGELPVKIYEDIKDDRME